MKTDPSKVRSLLTRLLTFTLVANGLMPVVPTAQAQNQEQRNRVIVVNADQPNVWTLEQAHYLLAQMHRRNLDLKATGLGDLDPNEINGLRFDVLRQLMDLGVKFDQAEQETNSLIADNQNFNAERRQAQLNRRDALQDESLGLTRDITDLQSEKASATTQEEKDSLDAKIAAKTSRRAEVDKRIEQINEELKTLNAPSGSLKATEAPSAFDASKLPKSVFDKAFEDAAKKQIDKFNEAPKLNATLRLENFLQMQYEIIAKQLTLLRDEVGPGERLLFLELPQTVNVTHHEADKKWAQSWWKITGYTKSRAGKGKNYGCVNPNKVSISGLYEESPCPPEPTSKKIENIMNALQGNALKGGRSVDADIEYVDLDKRAAGAQLLTGGPEQSKWVSVNDRTVRTVDLIPRQSSLNVNDMKLRVKAGAFSAVASFLFGFGARLNVQRQREQFSQFVQQELYSAAFGKGSREFGWTFTPMPGTDRLLSGVRTTYAVVVVPEEATSIILESNGCYFPRSAYQPNDFVDTKDNARWGDERTSRGCGNSKAFIVPVPSGVDGSNDFWVRGLSYQTVGKGKRIVVSISGSNFSSQVGVLINGVPLTQSIGLAQPLIRDDSKAGAAAFEGAKTEKIHGNVERIDANKILASFELPEDFEGTPTITVVAPGRALDLNWLTNIAINGREPATLTKPATACEKDSLAPGCVLICEKPGQTNCLTVADAMFKGDPAKPLRIDSLEVFRLADRRVAVLVTGAGFDEKHKVFINGVQYTNVFVSKSLLHVNDVPAPLDDKIQVTVSAGEKTIKSTAIANPAQLKIDKVTTVSYEAGDDKKPGVLVVRIEGSGFTDQMDSTSPDKIKVTVTSSTEAFLKITDPDETEPVTLIDPVTKLTVKTVITRKPPPK